MPFYEQLLKATVFVDYTVWERKALMDEGVAAEFLRPLSECPRIIASAAFMLAENLEMQM